MVLEAAMVLVALAVGEPVPVYMGNNLWLGSAPHAHSPQWLEAAGIGMVIDCRGDEAEVNMEASG